jgi:hypothetical protein
MAWREKDKREEDRIGGERGEEVSGVRKNHCSDCFAAINK